MYLSSGPSSPKLSRNLGSWRNRCDVAGIRCAGFLDPRIGPHTTHLRRRAYSCRSRGYLYPTSDPSWTILHNRPHLRRSASLVLPSPLQLPSLRTSSHPHNPPQRTHLLFYPSWTFYHKWNFPHFTYFTSVPHIIPVVLLAHGEHATYVEHTTHDLHSDSKQNENDTNYQEWSMQRVYEDYWSRVPVSWYFSSTHSNHANHSESFVGALDQWTSMNYYLCLWFLLECYLNFFLTLSLILD